MESEKWYKDGLKFGCRQCGRCCSGEPGYVWVSDAEIRAMAQELGISRTEFEVCFVREITKTAKSLGERQNGDCVLLSEETRRCMCYKTRPIQCRTWPFWRQNLDRPSSWKAISRGCPGCNNPDGKLYSLEEIEEEREKF